MHRLLALTALFCWLATPSAWAERADRDKPMNIEADRLTADDGKQTATFEGRVVLTQGSMVLRADKLVVRKDEQGFEHAVAHGSPATFRQRRDAEGWIDGEAMRIEFNGKKQLVELFERARLTRDKDEVRGNYISYDSRADFFSVKSAPGTAPDKGGDTRVRAVIQPKKQNGKAPAAEALPLQRSDRIETLKP